jgi:hypothetical protein
VRQRQDQVIRQIAKEPERVAGKRGRSSIKSPTSQTSATVARSIRLARCHDTLYYWVPVDGVNCSSVVIILTGLTQIEDDRNGRHTRPIKSRWGTGALMCSCSRRTLRQAQGERHAQEVPPQVVGHPSHIKACQPDGMYLTARAATDSLTTAKYEYVLGHNGYCSASH